MYKLISLVQKNKINFWLYEYGQNYKTDQSINEFTIILQPLSFLIVKKIESSNLSDNYLYFIKYIPDILKLEVITLTIKSVTKYFNIVNIVKYKINLKNFEYKQLVNEIDYRVYGDGVRFTHH